MSHGSFEFGVFSLPLEKGPRNLQVACPSQQQMQRCMVLVRSMPGFRNLSLAPNMASTYEYALLLTQLRPSYSLGTWPCKLQLSA